MDENSNPIMNFIVNVLGIICLGALAIQTWFFITWLMGPSEEWMKYVTLCFFDIFGGIWLTLRLYHTPPTEATYQAVRAGIVVDFILSAITTVAWTFIFITRTPLTPDAVAGMVLTARWLVAFAVIFNSFLAIYYSVETINYQIDSKHPNRKRWATETAKSAAHVQMAQVAVTEEPVSVPSPSNKRVVSSSNKPNTSSNKSIGGPETVEASSNKKKVRALPTRRGILGGKSQI